MAKIYQDPATSEEVAERAAKVLMELGPAACSAMPLYLADLRGTNRTSKRLTVSILSAIGTAARDAVPLLTSLYNGDGLNDLDIAEALWAIDRRTDGAVQVYLRVHQAAKWGDKFEVEKRIIRGLVRMAPATREVIPLLRELCLTGDEVFQFKAELMLRSIDASALDQLYAEANRIARQRVEQLVVSLGKQEIWVPTPKQTNFFRALRAMAVLGPEAKAAVPRLVELLTTTPEGPTKLGNIYARRDAARALGRIGDASAIVVATLASGLAGGDNLVACACCESLGRLGPSACDAAPALLQTLKAQDVFLRCAAAMALINVAPDTGSIVVPVLRAAEVTVADDSSAPIAELRNTVKIAVWKIEREGPSPIEDLVSDSIANLNLIGWFGPEAKVSLPELVGVVSTNNARRVRLAAADAIRRIDPAAYQRLHLPGLLALPEFQK